MKVYQPTEWVKSTNSKYSEINRDLTRQLNTPDQSSQYEIISTDEAPDYTYFDAKGKSFVYDFTSAKKVCKIDIYPDDVNHRVQKRHFSIYKYENDSWKEIEKSEWKIQQDNCNKSFHILFKNSIETTKLKIHNNFDDRNEDNVSVNKATFKNKKDNMFRIWLMDTNKYETYSYDGNGNRVSFTQNNQSTTIEYYKNNAGGNTPLVKYDGNWWYTYDKNGNRTAKGKAKLLNGSSYVPYADNKPGCCEGNVVIDKNYEYWEYTWDLNNRLTKVEQKKDEYDDELVCVKYTYDALNFRIEKESLLDQTVTKYVYGRNGALTYEEFLQNDTVVGSRGNGDM